MTTDMREMDYRERRALWAQFAAAYLSNPKLTLTTGAIASAAHRADELLAELEKRDHLFPPTEGPYR